MEKPTLHYGVYAFKVVPHDTVEGIDFIYQIARNDSEYSESQSSTDVVQFEESAPYEEITMKARVCNDDLCSPDLLFNFTTNVGGKGPTLPGSAAYEYPNVTLAQ